MRGEYVKLVESVLELATEDNLEQEFSSAKTSRPQVPALHNFLIKNNLLPENSLILDYGGGKFDKAKDQVEQNVQGATLLIHDVFNRDETHNKEVENIIKSNGGADVILNANVLNVIKEQSIRKQVLNIMKSFSKQGTKIFISVYNAAKKDNYEETPEYVGQQTSDGWQNAQPIKFYLPEVKEVFPNAEVKKGMIVATV
jgi:hypothetical protein